MTKKIKIITHTDFDGAAFPYVLEKLCQFYGGDFAISIDYCDVNNANANMIKDFEKLKKYSREELNNIFYLVSDIGYIGDADIVCSQIKEMQNMGLNFSYIDHHVSPNNQKMYEQLECMFYQKHSIMCASMMGFMNLLNGYIGHSEINDFEELYDYLNPSGISEKELFINNQEILLNRDNMDNTAYQKKFFAKMLGINPKDIFNNKIREFLSRSIPLIYAADFLDRGGLSREHAHEITKEYVTLVKDYLNISSEHVNTDLNNILHSIMTILNEEKGSNIWTQTEKITNDLRKDFFLEDRIEESFNNAFFITTNGETGIKNFLVIPAQGDIRYNIEGVRYNKNKICGKLGIEPIEIDGFITFTRFGIGHTPIMTIKPTIIGGNIFEQVEDLFKEKTCIPGMNAGTGVEYSKDNYRKISTAINNIVKGRSDAIKERQIIRNIMISILNEHFSYELLEPKKVKQQDRSIIELKPEYVF